MTRVRIFAHPFTPRSPSLTQVWCCAISKDGELVVSGSRDRTIRLWRVLNGSLVCTFNCNVDVFQVKDDFLIA